MVATGREATVRQLEEVCRLHVVECGGLAGRLKVFGVSGMQVDRGVVEEVVRSTGVVEVTVGTDDDARTIVLVDQTTPSEILIQITHAQTYRQHHRYISRAS